MANRRMFSIEVVGSDQFLDMPTETRDLYFHLGMYADDDGFVSPKKVVRMVGASDDSLKLLVVKGFVIPFESGVVVITHWKESNYIQRDRYKPNPYQLEYKKLACIQNVYRLDTECTPRLGKVRLGKEELLTGVSFEEFWNIYPRKEGKKKAALAWKKIGEEDHAKILQDIPRRKHSEQWLKDGGKFIPHATTYLNGERWNDEIIAGKKGKVSNLSAGDGIAL
jgi:hypothetical protein